MVPSIYSTAIIETYHNIYANAIFTCSACACMNALFRVVVDVLYTYGEVSTLQSFHCTSCEQHGHWWSDYCADTIPGKHHSPSCKSI